MSISTTGSIMASFGRVVCEFLSEVGTFGVEWDNNMSSEIHGFPHMKIKRTIEKTRSSSNKNNIKKKKKTKAYIMSHNDLANIEKNKSWRQTPTNEWFHPLTYAFSIFHISQEPYFQTNLGGFLIFVSKSPTITRSILHGYVFLPIAPISQASQPTNFQRFQHLGKSQLPYRVDSRFWCCVVFDAGWAIIFLGVKHSHPAPKGNTLNKLHMAVQGYD